MIDYYAPHRKILKKVIASLLVVSFLWYDIAWAGDLFSMQNYSAPQTVAGTASPVEVPAEIITSRQPRIRHEQRCTLFRDDGTQFFVF